MSGYLRDINKRRHIDQSSTKKNRILEKERKQIEKEERKLNRSNHHSHSYLTRDPSRRLSQPIHSWQPLSRVSGGSGDGGYGYATLDLPVESPYSRRQDVITYLPRFEEFGARVIGVGGGGGGGSGRVMSR